MQHVFTARINLDDYPDYVSGTVGEGSAPPSSPTDEGSNNKSRALDRPGLHLAENHALRGVRYAAGLGYMATLLYFYGYHRPRLPFAERPLAKLHHIFYPSAGYTTPVGLLTGLLYGAYVEADRVSEAHVAAVKASDKKAAVAAFEQYTQRKRAAEARLKGMEPWWTTLGVYLGLARDPKPDQLARMNFPPEEAKKDWTGFVKPYSMLWVEQRSRRVHDAGFYRGDLPRGCVLDAYPDPPAASSAKGAAERSAAPTAGRLGASKRALPPPATPPPHPCYTKDQVDGLVSHVLLLKHDKEESRWVRTGGRFSLYGMVTMLIAWNEGSLLFRLSMGLGAGAVTGGILSAMKLDDIWTHV